MLEQPNGVRVVHVLLAGAAPQVKATYLQCQTARERRFWVSPCVVVQQVAGDLFKADPRDTGRRPCEVLVDQLVGESKTLKYLRTLITL